MRLAVCHQHIISTADIVESLLYGRRIVVAAAWDQHSDRRGPRVVGITIGGYVDSGVTRRVDQLDGFVRLTPHANRAKLDVRNLNRYAGFAAYCDRFSERGHHIIGFVANVTHVDSAIARGSSRKRDHFIGSAWVTHVVFEPGRKSHG